MLIVFLSLTVPVIANEYECGNPTASYSCNKEGCERTFPDIDSISGNVQCAFSQLVTRARLKYFLTHWVLINSY